MQCLTWNWLNSEIKEVNWIVSLFLFVSYFDTNFMRLKQYSSCSQIWDRIQSMLIHFTFETWTNGNKLILRDERSHKIRSFYHEFTLQTIDHNLLQSKKFSPHTIETIMQKFSSSKPVFQNNFIENILHCSMNLKSFCDRCTNLNHNNNNCAL